jgi:hypothetical protein
MAVAYLALSLKASGPQDLSRSPATVIRANYLITAADDFIVNVYLNGKVVADEKRSLLEERFGATVERINVEVHKGDWLVFNVVNNRLRWGGAHYFAMAGCYARDEFGFVSDRASQQWSACDNPANAVRFIERKASHSAQPVQIVENPWSDGDALMRQHAGQNWNGTPLWGRERNTWIKVIVD